MIDTLRRRWPLVALLASLAVLAGAHAFQAAGYSPCALCLKQRDVYWLAIALAAAGLIVPRFWANPLLHRTFCVLLGVAFLAGLGVAAYHAGVEWKLIPAPACEQVHGTIEDWFKPARSSLEEFLSKSQKIVRCDEAAWRDPVIGLSMAGWNAVISLALAGLSFFAAARPAETGARE